MMEAPGEVVRRLNRAVRGLLGELLQPAAAFAAVGNTENMNDEEQEGGEEEADRGLYFHVPDNAEMTHLQHVQLMQTGFSTGVYVLR